MEIYCIVLNTKYLHHYVSHIFVNEDSAITYKDRQISYGEYAPGQIKVEKRWAMV